MFWVDLAPSHLAHLFWLEPLDQRGVGHAAGLAHGLQPVTSNSIFATQLADCQEAPARRADWVAERDGAAKPVDSIRIGAGRPHPCEDD